MLRSSNDCWAGYILHKKSHSNNFIYIQVHIIINIFKNMQLSAVHLVALISLIAEETSLGGNFDKK